MPVRYVFIVRHGERADRAPETRSEYKNHADAPLTMRGHDQATESGFYLQEEIRRVVQCEGCSFEEVNIKSSPFARCISSANQIASVLGIKKIDIDYSYGEWLAKWLYRENPIPFLERIKHF